MNLCHWGGNAIDQIRSWLILEVKNTFYKKIFNRKLSMDSNTSWDETGNKSNWKHTFFYDVYLSFLFIYSFHFIFLLHLHQLFSSHFWHCFYFYSFLNSYFSFSFLLKKTYFHFELVFFTPKSKSSFFNQRTFYSLVYI